MLVRLDRMSRIEEARSRAAQAPLFSSPLLSASIRPIDAAQPSGNKDGAGAAEQAAEGRAQMGSRREVVGGEEPEAMDQEKLNALAKTASEKVSKVSSCPVCCGVRPSSTRSFATSIAASSTVGSGQRPLIGAILCSRSFCCWAFALVLTRKVT